jgi:hypothetical protein
MEKTEDIINISELPEAAKAELLNFYESLKVKHSVSIKNKYKISKYPLERFVSNPIKVEKINKYTRDELHAR